MTKPGLEFFAGRAGQTVEEYCLNAILDRLTNDECDMLEKHSYFGRIRSEIAA